MLSHAGMFIRKSDLPIGPDFAGVDSWRVGGTIETLFTFSIRLSGMTDSPTTATEFPDEREYATYRHARQEAFLIFCAWAAAFLWAVPYCYLTGFTTAAASVEPAEIPLVMGIPSWVFWGIGVPWLVADLFTVWLCFFHMKDDDLGETHEGADVAEEIAEMHARESRL